MLALVVSGGTGVPAIVAVVGLMGVTVAAFAYFVRAPTPLGRVLLDEVEGLMLYMSVAERDELERLPGPGGPPVLDAARYEALLPFAVALEVEDAWTRKFTAAVGAAAAAAAAANIAWYHGGSVTESGQPQPRRRQQPQLADRVRVEPARKLVGVGRRRIVGRRGRRRGRRRAVGALEPPLRQRLPRPARSVRVMGWTLRCSSLAWCSSSSASRRWRCRACPALPSRISVSCLSPGPTNSLESDRRSCWRWRWWRSWARLVDNVTGALGARYGGASAWGVAGALLGAVAGLAFGLPGLVLGPFVGAVALELLKNPDLNRAWRVGLGTFLGLLAGAVLKSAATLLMVGVAVLAYFF